MQERAQCRRADGRRATRGFGAWAAVLMMGMLLVGGLHTAGDVQVVADSLFQPASSQYQYAMTLGDNTNIREEPWTKAGLVTRMSAPSTPVEVLFSVTNAQGEIWHCVAFGAHQGYVRDELLTEIAYEKFVERQKEMGGTLVDGMFILSPEQAQIVGGPTAPDARIGNAKTLKFHQPSCEYLPDVAHQVSFPSREAAEAAGYVRCKVCTP